MALNENSYHLDLGLLMYLIILAIMTFDIIVQTPFKLQFKMGSLGKPSVGALGWKQITSSAIKMCVARQQN